MPQMQMFKINAILNLYRFAAEIYAETKFALPK